jgi:hypothetical protein
MMMVQIPAEFLFPPRLIPELTGIRGRDWQTLVEKISREESRSVERIGFELFIVRLNNCMTCHIDSYRSLHGCLKCARQSIARFRGNDQELIGLYQKAFGEVANYLNKEENNYWKLG